MQPVTARPAWNALRAHYATHPRRASAEALRRRSGARRAPDGGRRRDLPRLLEEPGHRRDAAAARRSSPRSPACARGSTRCSAARRSTSPRTAPCCTSRCARRRAPSIVVDGENVVPDVHAVLDRMAGVREPGAQRRVEGPHRQAHPQRRQHRHRRLRPRAGDGVRGAASTTATRDIDVPLRLERRRHRLRRGDPRPRPGRDALHRLLEDLHDARDDDQRAHRARLAARRPRRRREGGREALRRGLDERRGGGEVRHRHRQHVRLLGLGRRALLDGLGDRPVDDARDRAGELPRDARRASTRWTSTSAPRRSRGTCRC